ncbi:MAG: ATP-dependent DNA helicase UvrD2 [Actinomycetia bacterium]|nr:ATP-dependent DNA helicase UvrD2 [Actinomycetes bacterium]
MPHADPTAILDALDEQQRQVATSIGGPLVVMAGAGTGKTRALTYRIAYAVATGRQDPRAVLAVTFTTRAAGELRGRLRALGIGAVQARTFHSAALSQVRYFWPRVMGGDAPEVLASPFGLLAQACGRAKLPTDTALLRDLAQEMSWAKTSNVTMADYPRLAVLEHRRVGALDPAQVAQLLVEYERIKHDRGLMDFDDILLADAALLSGHPEVASDVRAQYRHFLVDEYQDVSPIQHAVLRLWLGPGDDVCVVGDPAQSIHAFAGAQRRYLLEFRHEFPAAAQVELVRNYRSTRAVCALANHMARTAPGDIGAVTLQPMGAVGVPVDIAPSPDEDAEVDGVTAWLALRHEAGFDWSDLAVLVRVNAQIPPFEAALAGAGVPYVVRGGERFYERPEIKRALTRAAAAARTDPDQPALAGLEAAVTGLGWTPVGPDGAGQVREQWESWQALLGLARDLAADRPGVGLAGLMEALAERARSEEAPSATGVTLATMHSAKGLEWRGVALVGLYDGMVPFTLAKTPGQVAEEHRLLYVGITRAKEALRLSWSARGSGGRGQRQPSRFLTGLGLDLPQTDTAARTRRTRAPRRGRQAARCRVCGQMLLEGADLKLGRHADCRSDVDEALLESLKAWRRRIAQEAAVPAYVVFTDATLTAIAESRPADRAALAAVGGVGPAKLERYGQAVLDLVAGRL